MTAKDISLRLPNGEKTGEYFTTDQVLTVLSRNGPAGTEYWYVTDGERQGWVRPAPEWWRPLC
ncbi:MAG: hypothetical protein ACRDTC_05990 [Pseudonocardiaceae bacterium]